MHSSTSSSRKPAGKTVVASAGLLLVAATTLGLAETATRLGAAKLGANQRHIRTEMPRNFERLSEEASPGAATILFLGNSHTRRSIDVEALETELGARTGREVVVEIAHPDGSGLLLWYFLMRRAISEHDLRPNLLCVGFRDQALWEPNPEVSILCHQVLAKRDWAEARLLLGRDVETTLDMLASRFSATIALHGNIKKRILAIIIPGFEQLAIWMRGSADKWEIPDSPPVVLDRFMALCRLHGIEVVFWRVPTMGTLDEQQEDISRLSDMLTDAGASYFVPFENEALGRDLFLDDESHVNQRGRTLTMFRWVDHLQASLQRPVAGAPSR